MAPIPWGKFPLSLNINWPDGGCSSWRTSVGLPTRSTRTGGRSRTTCDSVQLKAQILYGPVRTRLPPGSGTCSTGPASDQRRRRCIRRRDWRTRPSSNVWWPCGPSTSTWWKTGCANGSGTPGTAEPPWPSSAAGARAAPRAGTLDPQRRRLAADPCCVRHGAATQPAHGRARL